MLEKKLQQPAFFRNPPHPNLVHGLTIAMLLDAYLYHEPDTTVAAWFQKYDIFSAQPMEDANEGALRNRSTGQGQIYYGRFRARQQSHQLPQTLTFEEWLLQQVPKRYRSCIYRTPHYTRREYSIQEIVDAYAEFQPQTSLQGWFAFYDIKTGRHKKGPDSDSEKGDGQKYAVRFKSGKRKGKLKSSLTFEEWICQQLPNGYRAGIEQTHHYRNQFSLRQILDLYIQHQPNTSLQAWFNYYDVAAGKIRRDDTGKRKNSQGIFFLNRYSRLRRMGGLSILFDEWLLQQVPKAYRERISRNPYYTKRRHTLENILEAFLQHQMQIGLPSWFVSYNIITGTPSYNASGKETVGQGSRYYAHYQHIRETKMKKRITSFTTWVLSSVGRKLQSAYLRQRHGVHSGSKVFFYFDNLLNGKPNGSAPKGWELRYELERSKHPLFMNTLRDPMQMICYLNLTPDKREEVRHRPLKLLI